MAKVKIPKRIAGVKVPKKVRKQAKKALKLTASPAVRDLALAGLTLAAEGIAAGAARERARPRGSAGAKLDGLDLGAVIHAAVAEGARRFLEGFEEGAAAAAPEAPEAPAAPRPPRKSRPPRAPA